MRDNYEAMKKVFFYQTSLAQGHIYRSMWGDHGGGLRQISPTACMYHAANILSDIADILHENALSFKKEAADIKAAFIKAFYDEAQGIFREQGDGFRLNAQILPLAFGMVDEEKKEGLFARIRLEIPRLRSLDAGIISVKYMFSMLTEQGMGELVLQMILDEQYNSYGALLKKGATTLWEWWDEDARSYDHHMYASVDEFFYRTLCGINSAGVGYRDLILRPYPLKDIKWCKAKTKTACGEVDIFWKWQGQVRVYEVFVPANAEATVYLPIGKGEVVLEGETPIEKAVGVQAARREENYLVCRIGSGRYRFNIE